MYVRIYMYNSMDALLQVGRERNFFYVLPGSYTHITFSINTTQLVCVCVYELDWSETFFYVLAAVRTCAYMYVYICKCMSACVCVLCMCVCVYSACVCVHARMHIHMYTYVCAHVRTAGSTLTYVHVHVHTYTHMNSCI
jgi:hypothetical protein